MTPLEKSVQHPDELPAGGESAGAEPQGAFSFVLGRGESSTRSSEHAPKAPEAPYYPRFPGDFAKRMTAEDGRKMTEHYRRFWRSEVNSVTYPNGWRIDCIRVSEDCDA